MAPKKLNEITSNTSNADLLPDNLVWDEFSLTSLAQAQLQGLPLTTEETALFDYVQKNENLSQEYYGLLTVMRYLAQSNSPTRSPAISYLLKDSQGRLHEVEESQTSRRAYLLQGGARLVGATSPPDNLNFLSGGTYSLDGLGLVLSFNSHQAQLGLQTRLPRPGLAAETSLADDYAVQRPGKLEAGRWLLELETVQQHRLSLVFDEAGAATMPQDNSQIARWKLTYQD